MERNYFNLLIRRRIFKKMINALIAYNINEYLFYMYDFNNYTKILNSFIKWLNRKDESDNTMMRCINMIHTLIRIMNI